MSDISLVEIEGFRRYPLPPPPPTKPQIPVGWYSLLSAGEISITGDAGLTLPHVSGYRARPYLADLISSATGGVLNWNFASWFNTFHDTCEGNGKTYGIDVGMGVETPTLVYSSPFNVASYALQDDSKFGVTNTRGNPPGTIPVPWDPNWINLLGTQILPTIAAQMASRAGGTQVCRYMGLTGAGESDSLTLSDGTTDFANLNTLAAAAGFTPVTITQGNKTQTYPELYSAMLWAWAQITALFVENFPLTVLVFTDNVIYNDPSNPTGGRNCQNAVKTASMNADQIGSLFNGRVPSCPPHTATPQPQINPKMSQAFSGFSAILGSYPGNQSYKVMCSAYGTDKPTTAQCCDDYCNAVIENSDSASEIYQADLYNSDLYGTWSYYQGILQAAYGN